MDSLIPLVDFDKCSIERTNINRSDLLDAGKKLLQAFSTVGFVYVKNAGITQDQVDDVNNATARFFTASAEDKQRYERKGADDLFGYLGIGQEKFYTDLGDYKEIFNVDGQANCRAKDEWPDNIAPGFSRSLLEFMERSKRLSMRILNALALAMELKDEHFFEKCHSDIGKQNNYTCVRTLYYPAIETSLQPGQVRLGAHADCTSITLLFQDSVGGLQIQNVNGEYVDAIPVKDTMLLNIGETLKCWTSGQLKSTKHRIVLTDNDERFKMVRRSLVFFVHPNHDIPVNLPLEYKDASRNKTPPDKLLTCEEFIQQALGKYYVSKK